MNSLKPSCTKEENNLPIISSEKMPPVENAHSAKSIVPKKTRILKHLMKMRLKGLAVSFLFFRRASILTTSENICLFYNKFKKDKTLGKLPKEALSST